MCKSPLLTLALVVHLTAGPSVQSRAEDTSPLAMAEVALVAEAAKILDAYHQGTPTSEERKLHLICWRPNDREYPADNAERMTRIMEDIREFFADEMERHGFGRRTIQLDYDDAGGLVIHHAVGSAPFADYKKPEGERVKADCWPILKEAGLNPDRETIVLFTNLSDWDPVKNTFFHKSPYYASGNNRKGLAWQLMSPELDTKNLSLKAPLIQDGEYGRISMGKHNSIFIGGIAHEVGHGLGLPHCRERDDEAGAYGTALMGSGNQTYGDELRDEGRGSFLTLAHALRLASHPQFSGSIKGMNLPSKATFSALKVEPVDSHFTFSGHVSSPVPVYAVIAYLDPEGGSDYDARTVCAVPSASGDFQLNCLPLVAGKKAAIRVVALMANGTTSTWKSSYEVGADGTPDISLMQTTTELTDFVEAINRDQIAEANEMIDGLPKNGRSRVVAEAIIEGKTEGRVNPGINEIPETSSTYSLSRVKADVEEVGWGKPVYNYLPREETIIVSGGRLYTEGIYAHAPARHIYEFEKDHDWKTLSGICGLPDQRGGSVVFRIKADGKEVFKTPTVEPGVTHAYEVDLADVEKLELLVDDAGDGPAVDWGYWFDPVLSREEG